MSGVLPTRAMNPKFGDGVELVESTGYDGRVIVRVQLAPNGRNIWHKHRHSREHFRVVSGVLSLKIGRKKVELHPGDEHEIPAKAAHRFMNLGGVPVVFEVTLYPAHKFWDALVLSYALARSGRTFAGAIPHNPLVAAYLYQLGETGSGYLPFWLQDVMAMPFAWIARRLAIPQALYDKWYK